MDSRGQTLTRVCALLASVAFFGLAACDRGQETDAGRQEAAQVAQTEGGDEGEAATTRWSTTGLATAEQLAGKVRAAGVTCEGFGPSDFRMLDAGYQSRLPAALAIASCTSDNDEDLTFEVFADAKDAGDFVDIKRAYLCQRAADMHLTEFPGFSYVDGGAWIVEPDQKETADKLAPILGAAVRQRSCK